MRTKASKLLAIILAVAMLFAVIPLGIFTVSAVGNDSAQASSIIQIYSQWNYDAYGSFDNGWICGSGCGLLTIGHALQWLGIIGKDKESSNATICSIFVESGYEGTVLWSERNNTLNFIARKYPSFSFEYKTDLRSIINNGGVALINKYGHQYLAVDVSSDSNYVHIIDSCLIVPYQNNVAVYSYNSSTGKFVQTNVANCAVRNDIRWYCSDVTTSKMVLANNSNSLYAGGEYWVKYDEVSGSTQIGLYSTHTHSYGAWQTVTAATCTAAGSQKRVCSCGDTQTQTIPALGHSSVTDQAVAATCTETGLTEGAHCSRCGTTLKARETVAALGHDFQVKSISSTCDSVTVTYKCSRCESEYSADSSSEAYSEWADSKPQNINEELIETRYSSRKKEYTTSTSSSLSNWAKYDTVQDGWNGWSNWQNTAVSATATRQVETRTVPAVTHTEYNYSRYLNSSAGIVGPWAGTWSGVYCGTYQERGWGVKLNNPDMSQGFAIYSDNRGGWFNETSRTVTDSAAYTQYRYRDAKYTYYYYKWSDYTAWTSQPIEADSETEVKTQYRYKIVPAGHTESDWIIDCPAQPGVAGAKHKECTECHTVLQTDIIPALEVIDENAPQVMIENKRVTAGGTVDIKIALKNNPGIASMKLQLNFGKDLILTNVAFNGGIGGNFQQPQTFASPVLLNWYDGAKNSNGDFVFATLTFKVADNATPGEKYIATTYDPEDVYNIAEQNIDFAVTGGKIEVLEYFPGDINGDGAVNNKDLTRLFQYLSGWNVAVNEAALDVNGDGNSNNKDLTRLFQYLSGWDVQIF